MMTEDLFQAARTTVNRRQIKEKMSLSANSIMNIIQQELKSVLFCLKMDIADRMGKILGINAQ